MSPASQHSLCQTLKKVLTELCNHCLLSIVLVVFEEFFMVRVASLISVHLGESGFSYFYTSG